MKKDSFDTIGKNLTTQRVVIKEAITNPSPSWKSIHLITEQNYVVTVDKLSLMQALHEEFFEWKEHFERKKETD